MKIVSLGLLCYFSWRLVGFATSNMEPTVGFVVGVGSQLALALYVAASSYTVSLLHRGNPTMKVIGVTYGIFATQSYFLLEESSLKWQVSIVDS